MLFCCCDLLSPAHLSPPCPPLPFHPTSSHLLYCLPSSLRLLQGLLLPLPLLHLPFLTSNFHFNTFQLQHLLSCSSYIRPHLASDYFSKVSVIWNWPSILLFFGFLHFSLTLFILFYYFFVSSSIFHLVTNQSSELEGHTWLRNDVGLNSYFPFVISHNKFNKQGCSVGCVWKQREKDWWEKRRGEEVREERREQHKWLPVFPK